MLFNIFVCSIIGLFSGSIIGGITEYYTSGKPVSDIADASEKAELQRILLVDYP